MKTILLFFMASFPAIITINAQIGIGTTTPNSTLDIRGSLSLNYRAFSASTTATATDNTLIFTGAAPATLTLPDATACTGRVYTIKNASTTSPAPIVTIATTSAQTIDGVSSWAIPIANETITLICNGANWNITSKNAPPLSIVTKTINYTATANDYSIVCNNTGGITISLPAASGANRRVYIIKKISGILNDVTINPNASETIDGALTKVLALQNESVMIQCDGTSWYILSKN